MPITVERGSDKKVIPTTPGMSLAEVMISACSHFRTDPNRSVLRHKKKDLDLTLSVRLSNLPNGCSVELCELSSEAAATRTVAVTLQRDVGDRVQAELPCTSSLWAMLERLEICCGSCLITGISSRGEVPNVSFMNRTVEGEDALRQTTLAQLGAVTGTALFKFSATPAKSAPASTAATAAAPDVEPNIQTSTSSSSQPSAAAAAAIVGAENANHEIEQAESGNVDAVPAAQVSEGVSCAPTPSSEENQAQGAGERAWSAGRPRKTG
mmetsp:Transcript_82972/g.222563  ORF Transcript_82972/g.222563 Transcript_82972/m.222563 type:complete len:267 (-) Transcript_82972:754-1554(-)